MPIVLPEGLPGASALRAEGLDVQTRSAPVIGEACEQGEFLRVALLNLMPDKVATETQFARLLAASPFPIHLTLVLPDGCTPKTTSSNHIATFYEPWSRVRSHRFDGLIVTGAPVEHLAFEQVAYWSGLKQILEWSRTHVRRSLFICWAAQAALYHFHGVPKRSLREKAFGVFSQDVIQPSAPFLRGFGPEFMVPVSRHTEVSVHDLPAVSGLRVLARSRESGLCMLEDQADQACFMFNHFEYDSNTLAEEYARDVARGSAVGPPVNCVALDRPGQTPSNPWRDHARLFFQNWTNEVALAARARGEGSQQALDPLAKPGLAGRLGALLLPFRKGRSREVALK